MKKPPTTTPPAAAKQDAKLAITSKGKTKEVLLAALSTGSDLILNKLAFSPAETAALLSISKRSLQRLTERRVLLPSRALRTPRYSRDAILQYLHSTT